jgi:hypothetical protein
MRGFMENTRNGKNGEQNSEKEKLMRLSSARDAKRLLARTLAALDRKEIGVERAKVTALLVNSFLRTCVGAKEELDAIRSEKYNREQKRRAEEYRRNYAAQRAREEQEEAARREEYLRALEARRKAAETTDTDEDDPESEEEEES